MLYGYRPTERGIILLDNEEPDESFRLQTMSPQFYDSKRVPVRRTLGCHFEGAALPTPDMNYAPDQVAGAVKRVAAKMPPINKIKLRKLKRFTHRWCKKHLTPYIFSSDETFDFEEWIQSTPYEAYRKDELREVYQRGLTTNPNMKVKAFIKNESYPAYKHVRGIYSRHDDYKCRVGPFFKKLGDIMFSLKWFIKKIPVNDRPQAMKDKFGSTPNLFCTDFSQYEATFVKQLMSIELIVYRFLLQNNPLKNLIINLIVRGMMSNNIIEFYKWTMKLMCKRMSGEMSTSVSNGFMNLLITHFLLEEAGNSFYDSFIEGDDSLSSYDVRPPTPEEYEQLGAKIKIEYPNNLCEASFCGQVFDEQDLDNVVNPMEALVSFGWTTSQYLNASYKTLRSLLKCKGLSLLYQYSGCPILRSVALYALRITNDIPFEDAFEVQRKEKMGLYAKEQWIEVLDNYKEGNIFKNTVKDNTRSLVERLYKIPITLQVQFEAYMDLKSDLSPINFEPLMNLCHKDWVDYYQTYSSGRQPFKTVKDLAEVTVTTGFKTKFFMNPQWYVRM